MILSCSHKFVLNSRRQLGKSGRVIKGIAIPKRVAGEWEKVGENIKRFIKPPCSCCQQLAKAAGYSELEIRNKFSEEAVAEVRKGLP